MAYTFSVYDFSEKEIEQIVSLVKQWATGYVSYPVDARKFSKQVKAWAVNWSLLESKEGRLFLTSGYLFKEHTRA